jgi:toxin ParE1/3/4
MSLPLIIRPKAEEDIADARDWYDARQQGMGDRFLEGAEQALLHIAQFPFATAEDSQGARKVLMRRFPYSVIYRVGTDHIAVIAVYHTSRRPRSWQDHT